GRWSLVEGPFEPRDREAPVRDVPPTNESGPLVIGQQIGVVGARVQAHEPLPPLDGLTLRPPEDGRPEAHPRESTAHRELVDVQRVSAGPRPEPLILLEQAGGGRGLLADEDQVQAAGFQGLLDVGSGAGSRSPERPGRVRTNPQGRSPSERVLQDVDRGFQVGAGGPNHAGALDVEPPILAHGIECSRREEYAACLAVSRGTATAGHTEGRRIPGRVRTKVPASTE